MSRIYISAAHKSSGKTTVSLGLCAAMRARGLVVQPFKKGPDYIDPMWLGRAAGRSCHNLDFYTMEHDEIRDTAARYAADADLSIIEGNKGLYDGLDLDGSNSNAALAKLLNTPVILVLDARGMTRGIAPLILGYQAFDPDINIAGVILNQLGGSRHEAKLRAVIEYYTDARVVGAVSRNPDLEITERHLGLIPSNESHDADDYIAGISHLISDQVDLPALRRIADSAPPLPVVSDTPQATPDSLPSMRIGIARDTAFGFYYADDLDAFERYNAQLQPVDMLNDERLPEGIDGLFIGGGFPESAMDALEANSAMRHSVAEAIEQGLPVYAECGGLMYLCRSLSWQGRTRQMVGSIAADCVMNERPQGRGYVRMAKTTGFPWSTDAAAAEIAAHEFHYSSLQNLAPQHQYAYKVLRGTGIDGRHDGIVHKNLLASYCHQRHSKQNPWVAQFLQFVAACRQAA